MSEIRAIETYYNGYHFRSRLEARWAVFFDAAGIEYQYEPEGFEMDDGTKYLPDFYLPKFEIYVEVKPNDPDRIRELDKCRKILQWGGSIRAILILSDVPYGCEDGGMWHFPILYYHSWYGVIEGWWFFHAGETEDSVGGTISSADYGKSIHRYISSKFVDSISAVSDKELRKRRNVFYRLCSESQNLKIDIHCQLAVNGKVFDALSEARSARFEHGESGRM